MAWTQYIKSVFRLPTIVSTLIGAAAAATLSFSPPLHWLAAGLRYDIGRKPTGSGIKALSTLRRQDQVCPAAPAIMPKGMLMSLQVGACKSSSRFMTEREMFTVDIMAQGGARG